MESTHSTEFQRLEPGENRQPTIDRVAQVLADGGIGVVPTDTVYGLVGDASRKATLDRMADLKAQPREKPFQILVASVDQARTCCDSLGRIAEKLIRLYWPGPLTLVLPARSGGTVGLRLPDHTDLRALLRACAFPLAATSANPHGHPPALDGPTARAAFDGRVDILLDGGPCPGGVASTVVALDGNTPRILRAGAIPAEAITAATRARVVFLHREGTCLAPMAALICRHMLQAEHPDLAVHLATATAPDAADPLPESAREAVAQLGYPTAPLDAAPLSVTELDRADRVVVTDREQSTGMLESMPHLKDRLSILPAAGNEVPRPQRGRAVVGPGYRELAVSLEKQLWVFCQDLRKTLA